MVDYDTEKIEKMKNKKRLVNNEFYVDVALNECIQLDYEVQPFQVKKFIWWGTPQVYQPMPVIK